MINNTLSEIMQATDQNEIDVRDLNSMHLIAGRIRKG